MLKKSLLSFIFVVFISFSNLIITVDAAESNSDQPKINCIWLPGCVDSDKTEPSAPSKTNNLGITVINNVIWNLIQFVAVIAVISLILSGIMYLVSWGEEEKAKKAKSWIIWSLVWVFLSISAWGIIGLLNSIIIK